MRYDDDEDDDETKTFNQKKKDISLIQITCG